MSLCSARSPWLPAAVHGPTAETLVWFRQGKWIFTGVTFLGMPKGTAKIGNVGTSSHQDMAFQEG